MAKDPYRYFRVEARELVEGLVQGVLDLEKGGAGFAGPDSLLRLAHTLKGAARVVKQPGIAEMAHAMEAALATHRDYQLPVPRALSDEMLRLLDAIGAQLKELEPPVEPGRDAPARGSSEEPLETVRVDVREMDGLLNGIAEATARAAMLHQAAATLTAARRRPHESVAAPAGRANGVARAASPGAGELDETLERLDRSLAAGVDGLERALTQVQHQAYQLRLVPVNTIFPLLERAVRDVAQVLDKPVEFHTAGGAHRVDAHVLAVLRDALLHVVRNAVAHGIESASARSVAGKQPSGRVELEVERRGSRVAFRCRDDGAGIDVAAIRAVAVRRGLLPAATAGELDLQQAVQLILRGGVSTISAVSEVAGRGIGLDVVRENTARLKGEVAIESAPGRGTAVEICVPISLSSRVVLLVEVADSVAAIPLDAVRGAVRLTADALTRAAAGESLAYGGAAVPYVPLLRVLRGADGTGRETRSRAAVVLQSGPALAAVGVDRLLGTTSMVARPLPALAPADPAVAGASLDAEGNPQLLLDPAGLVAAARAGCAAEPPTGARRRPSILVVDDSLTTRMLERSILESAGYDVDLATSGEEALGKARERLYGVFVVDVEMPGMDGFEFVTRTRADPVLRDIPSILVTSRNAAEDRRRGEEAGARAYIAKGEFDQRYLLQVIRDLVG